MALNSWMACQGAVKGHFSPAAARSVRHWPLISLLMCLTVTFMNIPICESFQCLSVRALAGARRGVSFGIDRLGDGGACFSRSVISGGVPLERNGVCGRGVLPLLQMSSAKDSAKEGQAGNISEGRVTRLREDDDERSSRSVRGSRLLRKLLFRLEAKAERIENKIQGKMQKWEKRNDVKGSLAKISKSPLLVVGAAGACILAVPAVMTSIAITAILFQVCSPPLPY